MGSSSTARMVALVMRGAPLTTTLARGTAVGWRPPSYRRVLPDEPGRPFVVAGVTVTATGSGTGRGRGWCAPSKHAPCRETAVTVARIADSRTPVVVLRAGCGG